MICWHCKKAYESKHIDQRYCSKPCGRRAEKARAKTRNPKPIRWLHRDRKRGQGDARACIRCNTSFIRNGNGHRYCEPCRPIVNAEKELARRQRRSIREGNISIGTQIECRKCGAAFIKARANDAFCSELCRKTIRAKRPKGTIITCTVCRSNFAAMGGSRQFYCSTRCAASARLALPKEHISKTMRREITACLRRGTPAEWKKGRSWEKLAGYTVLDLLPHLEKQFKPGMTWSNYGAIWHIDHVVPLAAFSFISADDRDFRAAWALSNLRPLEKRENLSKGARRTLLL